MPIVEFANLVADAEQEDNIAGNLSWIGVIRAKNFTRSWPDTADVTAGEITLPAGLTTILGVKEFAKIEVPQNSVRYKSVKSPDPGHQAITQSIDISLAGTGKAIQAELDKFKNVGCVFLVPGNDGLTYVVGSKDQPIFLQEEQDSGANGGEKRGTQLSGSSTGHKHHCLPLSAALLATVPFL